MRCNRDGISRPAGRSSRPLVTTLLLTACAGPAVAPIPADVQWTPFFWAIVAADPSRFPRAAIVLADPRGPARVSESLLQLDLAGSGTWPLGFPGTRESDSSGADDIRLHGLLTSVSAIGLARSATDVAQPARVTRLGTLGLQSFSTDLLFLDFKRERLGNAPTPITTKPWPASQAAG